jgi:D-amino peptidase
LFISSDMEGCAGIVDWSQCRAGENAYAEGRALLLGEVNAAITGAFDGGATSVLVNDSHGLMANISPAELTGDCSYLSGRHKPLYMMEGLDAGFDAVLFVGYHGSIGSNGTLSHTYNPGAVGAARLNGSAAGESGINALVALAHGVPVALLTGDQVTIEEGRPFLPAVTEVIVKRSITRFAAESLHPDVARRHISDGARRAVQRVAAREVPLPSLTLPARLEIDWLTTDMAEMAGRLKGVERVGERGTEIVDDDPLGCYHTFVTAITLTRAISGV